MFTRLLRCHLRRLASACLGNVEAQSGVGGEPFGVHPVEHWDAYVDVVVEFDVKFARVSAQETADVLDDSAFESEREGEEQRVEFGPVEPFSEV